MRPHEVRKYLFDISQACELLVQFSGGKTLEDFRRDALLRSAIERQFEIVGEALNRAIKLDPDVAKQVSDAHVATAGHVEPYSSHGVPVE